MATVDHLSATEFIDALATAARVLEDHAVALDNLAHPPPEDGSESEPTMAGTGTGSDLAATLSAAVNAAEGCTDFASACHALERGAGSASSGRAGRGAVTFMSGLGEVLCNVDRLDATRFALALEAAAERLAPGDDGSHPGGFSAVVAQVADAALSGSDSGANLADTIVSAADAGLEELERGPVADQRLARRGVVDAAAAGFLLVLDTLASVVTGEPLPARPAASLSSSRAASSSPAVDYTVSCRLIPDTPGPESAVHLEDVLREFAEITDWEVGGSSWAVGFTTPIPGAAVEALVEVGRPRELHIAVSGEQRRPMSANGSGPADRHAAGVHGHDTVS